MTAVYLQWTTKSTLNGPDPRGLIYADQMEKWDEDARRAFGARLRRARDAVDIKQYEMSEMLDKSGKQTVSAWETGKNVPTAEDLAIMAVEYGASCDWLLLAKPPVPLSADLVQRLLGMDPDELRRLENGIRGQLDMDPLPKAEPEKQRARRA